MKLASLHIYPIKGARGTTPQKARVEKLGLALDRRWMLVDAKGKFCSQRERPELGELKVEIETQGLLLDEDHLVAFDAPASERIQAQVWRDTLEVEVLGAKTQVWIRERFGQDLRLVRHCEQSQRLTKQQDPVAFADGFPILICNQASLEDLNQRIAAPSLDMRAFRPNLVIASSTPWAEDQWPSLKIGSATLELVSPCVRCKVTTLDPDNPHQGHPHKEPLRTLASFRRSEKGVTFGWNAALRGQSTTLRVGDPVTPCDAP